MLVFCIYRGLGLNNDISNKHRIFDTSEQNLVTVMFNV